VSSLGFKVGNGKHSWMGVYNRISHIFCAYRRQTFMMLDQYVLLPWLLSRTSSSQDTLALLLTTSARFRGAINF